ncbi:hypothetical protein P7C70_g7336, partial [Phenoliferia sp. Uapishka_3]
MKAKGHTSTCAKTRSTDYLTNLITYEGFLHSDIEDQDDQENSVDYHWNNYEKREKEEEEEHQEWLKTFEAGHRQMIKGLGYKLNQDHQQRMKELGFELEQTPEQHSSDDSVGQLLPLEACLGSKEGHQRWLEDLERRHRTSMRNLGYKFDRNHYSMMETLGFFPKACGNEYLVNSTSYEIRSEKDDSSEFESEDEISTHSKDDSSGSEPEKIGDRVRQRALKKGLSRKIRRGGPKSFTGTNVTLFLKRYEEEFKARGISNRSMAEALPLYVTESYFRIVLDLPGYKEKNWTQLKRSMKETFVYSDTNSINAAGEPQTTRARLEGAADRIWTKKEVSLFFERLVERAETEKFTLSWTPQEDQSMYFDIQPLDGNDPWMAEDRVKDIARELLELEVNMVDFELTDDASESNSGKAQPLVTC